MRRMLLCSFDPVWDEFRLAKGSGHQFQSFVTTKSGFFRLSAFSPLSSFLVLADCRVMNLLNNLKKDIRKTLRLNNITNFLDIMCSKNLTNIRNKRCLNIININKFLLLRWKLLAPILQTDRHQPSIQTFFQTQPLNQQPQIQDADSEDEEKSSVLNTQENSRILQLFARVHNGFNPIPQMYSQTTISTISSPPPQIFSVTSSQISCNNLQYK